MVAKKQPAKKPPATEKQREISEGRQRSLANLKPFKPGQTGNPGGRPKGKSLTQRLVELMDRTDIDGTALPEGKCVADFVVETIAREAIAGKFPFAKEVFDRIEGKVPDRIAGHDGGPLKDLSGLSDNDLDTLAAISGRMGAGRPGDIPPGR